MSQVWQTGRWQQCRLIVHIQKRKGSSPGAPEHPPPNSRAQAPCYWIPKGGAVFILVFIWPTMLNWKAAHLWLPSSSRQNISFPRAKLPQSVSSLLSENQTNLEDVEKMALLPPWNSTTKVQWPLSAYCWGSSKSTVDILSCQNANGILNTPCSTEF